jgi:hypothetical protein
MDISTDKMDRAAFAAGLAKILEAIRFWLASLI